MKAKEMSKDKEVQSHKWRKGSLLFILKGTHYNAMQILGLFILNLYITIG